tara:strand:+ start:455 stop:709 length:255 start_codon:yes stop_codon:yes gene_type:complete
MSISPILAGAFTGVETSEISFNPTSSGFLHGYYNLKNSSERIKHLEDLTKKIGLNVITSTGGLGLMIKELKDDPFKYDKGREYE